MIKVDRVHRDRNNVPVSLEISVGNVTITFVRHISERKVVECGRKSDAQVYDRHNMLISAAQYVKVLKMAYAILYALPKLKKEAEKEAPIQQLLDLRV